MNDKKSTKRFRPLKYWAAETMNRLGFPSWLFFRYRRTEVCNALKELWEFRYDRSYMEKIRARAPRRSHHSNIERLCEAVKFTWKWRNVRAHWREVGDALRESLVNIVAGAIAAGLFCFGLIACVPMFLWRYTVGLVIEAVWLTPRQLNKIKQINRLQ